MSGSGTAPLARAAARSCQRVTSAAQASGISASTASRARTSSWRLVSCVDSVVMVAGQSRASRAANSWNSAGLVPKASGSPPTSFSAASRDQR